MSRNKETQANSEHFLSEQVQTNQLEQNKEASKDRTKGNIQTNENQMDQDEVEDEADFENPEDVLKALDPNIQKWSTEEVARLVTAATQNLDIGQEFFENEINGKVLIRLNDKDYEKLNVKTGFKYMIKMVLEENKFLITKDRKDEKVTYNGSTKLDKDNIINTLFEFEVYLRAKDINLNLNLWRSIFQESFTKDLRNTEAIIKINEKISLEESWKRAKLQILEILFPDMTSSNILEKFMIICQPKDQETIEHYLKRTINCAELTESDHIPAQVLINIIISQFNSSDQETIAKIKKIKDITSYDDLEKTVQQAFPITYSTKWVKKKKKEFQKKQQWEERRNERKRKDYLGKDKESNKRPKEESKEEKKKQEEKLEKGCDLCDIHHKRSDCWYLFPNKSPKDWKGKKQKEQKKDEEKPKEETQKTEERVELKMNQSDVSKKEKSNRFKRKNKNFNRAYSRYYIPVIVNGELKMGLIDSGATHIFISQDLVNKWKLPILEEKKTIHLLDNAKIEAPAVNIKFRIQEEDKEFKAYVIQCKNEDLILGTQIFPDLGISISFDFNVPLENEMLEVCFKPSKGTFEEIDSQEKAKLIKEVQRSVQNNLQSKYKFLKDTFLENDYISIPVPKVRQRWMKQYRIPDALKEVIDKQVAEWLEMKIIEKADPKIQHNTPITITKKKDNSYRVCLDFRMINEILATNDDVGALPNVDEMFQKILEAKPRYFSIIDLKAAYHKMVIDPKDRWVTKFAWRNAHYQFIGAPFGVRTFPAIFSKIMHQVMEEMEGFALNYLDDVIIFSRTLEDHIQHVNAVLDKLSTHNLTVNDKKCKFGYKRIKVLGHFISADGLEIDKSCLKQLDEWKRPTTGKEMQRLLGWINFFRRYFISEPNITEFNKLRLVNKFHWTDKLEETYQDVIDLFKKSPVLHLPNYDYRVKIGIDASFSGLGMIVYQDIPVKRKKKKFDNVGVTIDEGAGSKPEINHQEAHNDYPGSVRDDRSKSLELKDPFNTSKDKTEEFSEFKSQNFEVLENPRDQSTERSQLLQERGKVDTHLPENENNFGKFEKNLKDPETKNTKTDKEEVKKVILKRQREEDDSEYERRAIMFNSRSLKPHEKRYKATKLEALGLCWALKCADPFIRNNPNVDVYTDHQSLINLFSTKNELMNTIMESWSNIIRKYQFKLHYIKGIHNTIPDFLSRAYINRKQQEIKMENEQDEVLFAEELELFSNEDVKDITEEPENVRNKLIDDTHKYGHYGARQIMKQIKRIHKVKWKNMYESIIERIQGCSECAIYQLQTSGFNPAKSVECSQPGDMYIIDIAAMPKSTKNGNNAVLICIDVCTRFVKLKAIQNKTSREVGDKLLEIMNDIGYPRILISDDGSEFTNKMLNEAMELIKIERRVNTPYYKGGTAIVERNIQTFKNVLKKQLTEETLDSWDDYLGFTQFYLNIKIHELINCSPFQLFYGRSPNLMEDYSKIEWDGTKVMDIESIKKKWDLIGKMIYPNLFKITKQKQEESNKKLDEQRIIREFRIGDHVMYLKREMAESKIGSKLVPVYNGPMEIKQTTKHGHYRGIDLTTNTWTRVLPPSHLKLFATIKDVVEERKEPGKEATYLVKYSNGEELWVEKSYIPKDMLNRYKIKQKLIEEEKKLERRKIIEEELKKKEEEIISLRIQLWK